LPLQPSEEFKNVSEGGIYRDVVEELDHYIGQVLQTLTDQGVEDNTIVIFTSDNGPWFKGSPGEYRGRKGQSYEGGFRVPLIVKWSDRIAANTVLDAPVMNIDIFPTLLNIAGISPPKDRIIDGKDLTSLWMGNTTETPHDELYFYHFDQVEAVRVKNWKYVATTNHYVWPIVLDRKGLITHDFAEPWFGRQIPNLYDLEKDPVENYDVMHHYPEVEGSMAAKITNWENEIKENPNGWIE
jgi:arylsulfatase A